MKILVCGSRSFRDYDKLVREVVKVLRDLPRDQLYPIEIVSGKQVSIDPVTKEKYGADYLGEKFAKQAGYPVKTFAADWSLGPKAGPIRNTEMSLYADIAIAFFVDTAENKGTSDMVNKMRKLNKDVYIIK